MCNLSYFRCLAEITDDEALSNGLNNSPKNNFQTYSLYSGDIIQNKL